MDAGRWSRVNELFHALADAPPAAREEALAGERDADVVAEVRRMLEADAAGDALLDRGLAGVAAGMLADPDEAAAGREIGSYRLVRLLGEGGMGVVHLAERREIGGQVAIKLLRDAWMSPARRQRFAAEQRVLAQLHHPGIARLFDAGALDDGTPWFAMEHVEGEPITAYCARHRCDLRRRLTLFREVCEAVLHAHQQAVIHRDLKPTNILVAGGDRVKLLDFGIAKSLEPSDSDDARTRTGLQLMTPAYAAPEQVAGGPLGVHTDLYSLGVILFELLTGALPSAPGERASVRAAAAPGGPEALEPVRASRAEWADLDVLVATAMHAEPARRYRTVDSLIRDVDHFLRGEPLEARPDSAGYRLGKFVGRHRAAVLGVGTGLLVVLALATFYTVRLRAARNAALAEAERTRTVQDFMTRLFEGGDPDVGPSDTLRVVTLLDAGEREARTLAGTPAIQADLEMTLGTIHQELGRLDRADTLLTHALAVRRALQPAPLRDVQESMSALALLRLDQSRLDEADSLAKAALALQSSVRADPAGLARATSVLGRVLEAKGEYEPAIATLQEAARLDSLAGSPPRVVAQTLTELANCLYYAGALGRSDSLNRRVLAIDRALHGEAHPAVASDLINLGAIQQDLGQYAAAESLYRAALAIYRNWYGEDHFETAATLTMVGRVLLFGERKEEAGRLLREALAVRERVYGPDHPSVASTLNEIARMELQLDRLDEADRDFRRVLAIYRRAYDGKHYLVGVALSNLAGIPIRRGRGADAEPLLREAIALFRAQLGDQHLQTGIGRIKLGRALMQQRRFEEAEQESRAGYQIVAAQTDPAAAWLDNAREDLAKELDALGRGAEAARFRAEMGGGPGR